ncbi:MAG: D-2-hydroxyacid dehydrogenase [Atribacterota bacterium]|nr:D-2-hydroxyacid dehydrogenase [Atribacterota bacterium]
MITILIKDKVDPGLIEELKERNFIVRDNPDKPDTLLKEVRENEILIIRSATKVTREVIDAAADTGVLKLIIRAGVGMDNIDVAYAKKRGITALNTPEASSSAVAELVLAHMFTLARRMVPANLTMRERKWAKKLCEGIELSGKILGIVGMGRIGQLLAQKASVLGMRITYTDIMGPINSNPDWKFATLSEVLEKSDFISLHVPASDNGNYLIDEPELKKMKKSAFLINTARGNLVNEKALLKALDNGGIAGAGVDVYIHEPCDNFELIQHEKISVTPHVGGSTKEAQYRIGQQILSIIEEYKNDKEFPRKEV